MPDFPLVSTLADIEAIEATPWRSLCPFESTYEAIQHSVEHHAERDALIFLPTGCADETPHIVSYRDLFANITKTANLLHELGVGRDDVVSYILPNIPETLEVIWGAEAAGIVNAINPLLEPETIFKLLKAAGSKVLVTSSSLPGMPFYESVLMVADALDTVDALIVIDMAPYYSTSPLDPPQATPGGKPIIKFHEARDRQASGSLDSGRTFNRTDIASLFHTGGTTSTPKLAPHTHENEVFTSWAISNLIPVEPGGRALVGLPLFHVNAVIATGLGCLVAGTTQVMLSAMGYRGPDVIPNLWKVVERYKAVSMSAVPTVYSALMSVPHEGVDISSLRFAAVGAAPLSTDVFEGFVQTTGVELLEGYGLTESTIIASCNPFGGEKRIGSIGLRIPYQEMASAVLDKDGEIERFCDVDEVGTVMLRGPNVFPGYYRQADTGLTRDGWLNTGDLGRSDAEGYFWLTGRAKDLIIRGGHNIDPAMVENTLERHDAVALAAAVGQPDAYAGELPAAYVELHSGAEVDPDELKDWAKAQIEERAAAPVHVEIMPKLPLTAVGKIHKPPLRMLAIRRVLCATLLDAGIDAKVEAMNDPKRGLIATIVSDDAEGVRAALSGYAMPIEVIATAQ